MCNTEDSLLFLVGSKVKFSTLNEVKVIFSRFMGKNLAGS